MQAKPAIGSLAHLIKISGASGPEDINLLRELAQEHLRYNGDWTNRKKLWNNAPATDSQIAYLKDLGFAGNARGLAKNTASDLIDAYSIALAFRKQKAWQEESRRSRNAKLNATPPRSRITRATQVKWLYEFQELWNRVLEDNAITVSEAEDLKAWLNGHRTINIMHDDFIRGIDAAMADGLVNGPESEALYQFAIKTVEALGGRPVEE